MESIISFLIERFLVSISVTSNSVVGITVSISVFELIVLISFEGILVSVSVVSNSLVGITVSISFL